MVIPTLSQDITNERISMPYPHIKLLEPSDAVALILPELPEGDLPVLCEFNNACRQIGSIMKSAIVINNLKRVSKLSFVKSDTEMISLDSAVDILEVLS